MNTTFLKEWDNYSELEKLVKKAILKGIRKGEYIWQPKHNKESQRPFKPSKFSEIDNLLGFAYTSTGIYAGLWCCNGGYLLTQEDKHFVGFAINTDMQVIAITEDEQENPTYINFTEPKKIVLTELIYVLQENTGQGWEDSVTYDNYKEAKEDLKAYRENSKYGSRLIKRRELKKFSREYLMSLPTIHKGHFDDVKLESKKYRILVSRMTKADGAIVNNEVTILKLNSSHNWVEISKF